ncbi:uncharacterized protein LOC119581256 [Penaeus monodon]|uniref:uncharacterized protein LOC119581256 n=1 Tax=Penaeus monodon TaxID=6687 RepID=UPI0018A7BA60|nr:uncharacterized protein LOC119581256 [Penaeus monodon]
MAEKHQEDEPKPGPCPTTAEDDEPQPGPSSTAAKNPAAADSREDCATTRKCKIPSIEDKYGSMREASQEAWNSLNGSRTKRTRGGNTPVGATAWRSFALPTRGKL